MGTSMTSPSQVMNMESEAGVYHMELAGLRIHVDLQWTRSRVLRRIRLTAAPEATLRVTTPVTRALEEMALGRRDRLGIPMEQRGTAFQRRVWGVVAEIPRGETLTYGQVARQVGCASPRAVGQALGANPFPLVVPCHRVVSAEGIGGFSCGIALKKALLRLEHYG